MKWIKMPTAVADAITVIPPEWIPEGLELPDYNDAREILVFSVVDGFTYLAPGLYTLPGKNRDRRLISSEMWEEIESSFLAFAEANDFEIVTKIIYPEIDIESL